MKEKKAHRKKNLNSSATMIGLLLMVGIIAGTIVANENDMRKQEQTYIQKEESLKRDIAQEENRTATLKEKKKYVTTDNYIKEVAKDKLGLLSPDEILLKEKNN